MIKKIQKDLIKRFFGGKAIKKVFYHNIQIWPIEQEEFNITPTTLDFDSTGGTKTITVEATSSTEWFVEE